MIRNKFCDNWLRVFLCNIKICYFYRQCDSLLTQGMCYRENVTIPNLMIIGSSVAQIWLFCTMIRCTNMAVLYDEQIVSRLIFYDLVLVSYWHIFRFAQSIIQILFSKHNMFSRKIQCIITTHKVTQRRGHRILKQIWRNELSNDCI